MVRLAVVLLLAGCAVCATATGEATEARSWLPGVLQSSIKEDAVGQLAAAVLGKLQPQTLFRSGVDLQRTTDRLINELRSPGMRASQRVEQVARIGADALTDSDACAVYTFTPGGEATPAKWIAPTFTLTQTTGSCIVQPAFRGEGNTRWTRLQNTLACLGPSTQWGWTPLTYEGPSKEPATLTGPNCKFTYKFGAESTVKLSTGQGTRKYASEKDFYTDAVLTATMGADINLLTTALSQVQAVGPGGRVRDGLLGRSAGTPWRELLGGGQGLNLVVEKAGKTADFAQQIIKSVATGASRTRGLGSRTLFGFRKMTA